MNKKLNIFAFSVFFILGVLTHFLWTKQFQINQKKLDPIYLDYQGVKVLSSEVLPKIQNNLTEIEKNKYWIIKKATEQVYIEKKQGEVNPSQRQWPLETSPEFELFLQQAQMNRKKMTEQQLKDAYGNFKIFIESQEKRKNYDQLNADLEAVWNIPMDFLPARVKVSPGFLPALVASKSPHQIIFVGNYQCPRCSEIYQNLVSYREVFEKKSQVYFRFLVNDTVKSIEYQSVQATYCANKLGKGVEFFHRAFQKIPMNPSDLLRLASESNINEAQFKSCLEGSESLKSSEQEILESQSLLPQKDPRVFVNGIAIEAAESFQFYMDVLNQNR